MIRTQSLHTSRLVNRSPIFYGWVVWAVATLGMIATSPGQSFTVSLFFDRFILDFGLDRTTVSGLYGLGTFIGALTLTWVGRQIDLRGNRLTGVIISALFALVLMALSLISGPLTLLLGFIAIRGLGQGSLSLVNSTAVAQWFKRHRGRMLSLTVVIFALFQSAYIPWLHQMLESFDWRQVWIILGLGVGLTILPITWLLMRNRPEDFGLYPDGQSEAEEQAQIANEDNWTLSEAKRTPIFWIFIAGRLLWPAWGTGLIIHVVSLFGALGYEPIIAAETLGRSALVMGLMSLVAGGLIDRFHPGRLIALQMTTYILTLVLAMGMSQPWMLVVFSIVYGMTGGIGSVFDGAVWVNLFGRQHQGAIRGFVITTQVLGSALGPVLFGLSYDFLGGYNPVLWLGIALGAFALVLSFFARKPQRQRKFVPVIDG